MTNEERAEFVKRINEAEQEDPETGHVRADAILIEFIRALGYDDVADAWEQIEPKWYA